MEHHNCLPSQSIRYLPSANPGNQTVCNGELTALVNFTGTGATYDWTNDTPSIGLATNGTGDIPPFTAINLGAIPVTATITVIPNSAGCPGGSQVFTITVNPTPVVNNPGNQDVCNGVFTGTINFTGTGSSYSWINNNPFIGLAAGGTGDIAAFTAVNNGTVPEIATIIVTPSGAGCTGAPQVFTITVNPTPSMVSTLTPGAICSGSVFNYIPSSAVGGATFAWSRAGVAGIAEGATGGPGNVSETLTNTTLVPVPVTYVFITSANGCAGPPQNVTVTVNPAEIANAGTDIGQTAISIFTLAANTPVAGTGQWTIVSGSGNITDALSPTSTVTGIAPGTSVTLRWTITLGSCSHSDDVVLTSFSGSLFSFVDVDPAYTFATRIPYINNRSADFQVDPNFATLARFKTDRWRWYHSRLR